jgi:NADPH-ferrihemoprotein reductase
MFLVNSFITPHRILLRYVSTNRTIYSRYSLTKSKLWSRYALASYSGIRILYGSQGGTAQMFGMQLKEELENIRQQQGQQQKNSICGDTFIDMQPLNDINENTLSHQELHIILVSVAGVGEPPDNARKFYAALMERTKPLAVPYTIFGLGNSIAHPSNYNVIGKHIDTKLQALGAKRIHPMGLGDDGNCIEDDFDVWMEGLVNSLRFDLKIKEDTDETQPMNDPAMKMSISDLNNTKETRKQVEASIRPNYIAQREPLQFQEHEYSSPYSLNLKHISFYPENVQEMTVLANHILSPHGGEQAIRELCFELPPNVTYQTGDHIILYPQNSTCMVDSVLQQYNTVNPHALIVNGGAGYSKPIGLSLYETLLHTVDLGAVPSPSSARSLLQKESLDYKQDIVLPHRTVLELLHMHCSNSSSLSSSCSLFPLQDLLHMLPTMQPRYYSIASSSLADPNRVCVAYRPIKYVSKVSGHLREGVCTSYMSTLTRGSRVMAGIRTNPKFRLPQDPNVPIICIAGGCGVAPVRAFLEERLYLQRQCTQQLQNQDNHENGFVPNRGKMGDAMLFLGFRSPYDQVYQDLVQESLNEGTLSEAFISFSGGSCVPMEGAKCQLISQTVRDHGDKVWDWIENRGAHVYLCGGARSFGTAVEAEIVRLIQIKSGRKENEAFQYLRQLISEGRLCEDLAD